MNRFINFPFSFKLEIMENKRLVEESRIFNQELKIANETKMENEKLNAKLAKIDSFYRKKIDDNLIKKANIKVIYLYLFDRFVLV